MPQILPRAALALLMCAPLLLAGCVDLLFDSSAPPEPTPSPPGPVSSPEKDRFVREVYPILALHCESCHSQAAGGTRGFLGATPEASYDIVVLSRWLTNDFQPNAPIATLPAAGHNGVLYTAAERAAIQDWLAAELAARGGSMSAAANAALEAWAGCLQYNDYFGVNAAWGALMTATGQCKSCHTNTDGLPGSTDPALFFQRLTSEKLFMLKYFTVDLTQGPAAARVILNPGTMAQFASVGAQKPPWAQHPAFNFINSPAELSLLSFYSATAFRRDSGTCGPPRVLH